MITDPKTLLENKISRIIFGALVAIGFFILQFYINENYALLASLFLGTCIIPILSYFDQKILYKNISF
jgi:Na+-translocating ferredoxin:NAD+ oxidoreductase RnfD subunit